MRQIFLLILLFIVGQWLVKALRRHDAQASQRAGAPVRMAPVGQIAKAARMVRTAARVDPLPHSRSSPSR